MRYAIVIVMAAAAASAAMAASGSEAAPPEIAPGMALVAVDGPAPGTAAALLSAGVMVVRDMERYLLLAVASNQLALLDRLGLRWQILDPSILDSKTYYTVRLSGAAGLGLAVPGVRVLRDDGIEAVIEATPAVAETASGRFEIARVFMRPIRLAPAAKAFPPVAAIQPDPRIQEMVNLVSIARVNTWVQRLQDFRTRQSAQDSADAAARWIRDQFLSFGIADVSFHHWSTTYSDNVVAVIPGVRDPAKIVLLGGHYDSTTPTPANAPGADDDATGTACVLEVARILSQYPLDYTVTLVAFSGEEQGLLGSEAYATMAAGRGDDITGMIQVDMIGYLAGGDIIDLDIIDNASSRWMRDLVIEVGNAYVPGFSIVPGTLPGGASSDHASFWANGYDAILFFEDSGNYSPYIHTTSDVVGTSYNSPVLAERSVKSAVALVATMASAPRVILTHTPLPNTTDTAHPYRVVAGISAVGPLNPDSVLVRWSTPAGTFDAPLAPTGNPDEFEGFIPAQPGGTFVGYYILAEDMTGYRVTSPPDAPAHVHTFFVGTITTVLADDLEAESGWTVGDTGDNATTGIWVRADPVGSYNGTQIVQPEDDHTPAPGVACWVTGNALPGQSQGTNDVDGGKTTVKSPSYDLSALPNAWVSYYRWYTNDTGGSPGLDTWVVDVSNDGGATWRRLEDTQASERSWWLVEKPLPLPLTAQMRFRFVASDYDPGSIVEAAIDDFSIVTFEEPTTAVAEAGGAPARAIRLEQNAPNPFNPWTEIRLWVPAPGERVTLRIVDASGREVRRLVAGELVAGERVVSWDGRDSRGREVPSAVYFYRLTAGEKTLARRLVVLR